MLGAVYIQKAEIPQAIAEARRGAELDPNDLEQSTLGYVCAMAGKVEEAEAILKQLTKPGRRPVSPVYLSLIYIGLHKNDRALKYLEQASRDQTLLFAIGPEAMFDPIRSDPRFKALMQRNARAIR